MIHWWIAKLKKIPNISFHWSFPQCEVKKSLKIWFLTGILLLCYLCNKIGVFKKQGVFPASCSLIILRVRCHLVHFSQQTWSSRHCTSPSQCQMLTSLRKKVWTGHTHQPANSWPQAGFSLYCCWGISASQYLVTEIHKLRFWLGQQRSFTVRLRTV